MALRHYANAPATTLANSCTALATSIVVTSTTGLPISYPYTLILDRGTASEEAVSVTAAASTTLTVTRGIDGTTAFTHSAGASVAHGITAQDIREANSHVNATSDVHGATGALVGLPEVEALLDALLLTAHPVGSIKMSTVNTNPSTYIGGTWVAWGSGRVPVGVDAAQAEFDTAEETGGAKTHTLTIAEMPSHNHGGATSSDGAHSHTHDAVREVGGGINAYAAGGSPLTPGGTTSTAGSHNHAVSSQGGGAAHNNLQPYITCYMFKRTA